MKKTGRRIACMIGVGLVCSTAFGGCGFGGAKTDEEIYAALADATENFLEYKDALTVEMKYIIEENDKETENASLRYSINPQEGKMYCSLDSKDTDITVKVFSQGEKSYVMSSVTTQKSHNGGNLTYEEEKYEILSEDSVKFLTSMQSFTALSQQDLSMIFQEYMFSFTETKAAYETVYAEQVEERRKSDSSAYAEYNLTTKKKLNSISLEEYSQIKKQDWSASRGRGTYTITEKSKLIGKRGKVAQVKMERELSFSNSTEEKEKRIIQMDIDYSFDKKGYKKIKTELPDTVSHYAYSEDFTMNFNVCGLIAEKTVTAYSFDPQSIFDKLKKDFHKSGCMIEWYLDAAYTNPFVPQDLTYEQFHDVECVYGKVTVYEGNAIIARDHRVRDERTDAYKAVFGPVMESALSYEGLERKDLEREPTYNLPITIDGYESFVNGKPYDETSNLLNLESGKFYLVEHTKIVTDEEYSIFDVDVSSLWAHGEGIIKSI